MTGICEHPLLNYRQIGGVRHIDLSGSSIEGANNVLHGQPGTLLATSDAESCDGEKSAANRENWDRVRERKMMWQEDHRLRQFAVDHADTIKLIGLQKVL